MTEPIKLPPLPRLQVPRIDADVDLMDIRRLAQWAEGIANEHAIAAVEADRQQSDTRTSRSVEQLKESLKTRNQRFVATYSEVKNLIEYYEAALQSQDREDADLVEILREAAEIIAAVPTDYAPENLRGPIVNELEGFALMLDHARRIEGIGNE